MTAKTQKSVDVKTEKKEIERLRNEIKELASSIDELEDEKLNISNQLKRALADYQNLEINTQKRLDIKYMQARKSLAEKLIPLVDDITMALKAREGIEFNEKGLSWAEGVEGIFSNLEKSLDEIGVKKYVPQKESAFDPSLHEALAVVDGKESNTIFDVIQPGYILDDTVIRPARVVVTKSKN